MPKLKLNRSQLRQALVNKKCIICKGDITLNIEFNNETLLIIFHTTCKQCGSYFKHLLSCKSIEQLEQAQFEIAKSTLETKGFISGWGYNW